MINYYHENFKAGQEKEVMQVALQKETTCITSFSWIRIAGARPASDAHESRKLEPLGFKVNANSRLFMLQRLNVCPIVNRYDFAVMSRWLIKLLIVKSMAKLPGPRSGTAWAGRTGENKRTAFQSQPALLAMTGSIEESVLPLVLFWLSLRIKMYSMPVFARSDEPFDFSR